jgi:hypothetical protein
MKCCLCRNPDVKHAERRYTGRNGKQLQPWGYCQSCFEELCRERLIEDPEISARYVVFLKVLASRYDRQFNGNRAS